ncbi:hypothetical protein D3C81_1309890 [compost metagenome]
MRKPLRSLLPRRARQVARMPANTPMAACGDGSPDAVVLVTWGVLWAMQSMSSVEVPLSTAMMKRPCRVSMKCPSASNSAARFSTCGLRMTTALPPPNASPASAAL